MNKIMLMGRPTHTPEIRYSTKGAEPIVIASYSLAVNRRFKREGETDVDFINCVAFGKQGEFVEKYVKKGQMVAVVGRLAINNYTDKNGNKRTAAEVIAEEHYFAESKKCAGSATGDNSTVTFVEDETLDDDDLPF
jgi:single-strand DNA-binding protein